MMELKWKSEWTTPSLIGVVSFGAGIGVGYAIRSYLNSRMVRSFQQVLDEIEEADQLEFRFNGHDTKVYELVEDEEQEDHEDLIIDRSFHPSVLDFNPEHRESNSIFPEIDPDWDWAVEMPKRNPDNPYIITIDEYMDDDQGYSQSTLTYYKGDDVLTDELDMPIYNAERIASPLIFGKGSRDPSIVYIRNERLEAEYEVIIDHGYFQVEILGQEFESSFDVQKAPLHKFKEE